MKKGLLFIFLTLILFSVYALDITSGSIMLSIDERSGIFKLYHIANDQKTKTSLLYEQDTRTSYVLIASGNRMLKLNDNFSAKIERTEKGAKITYTSDIAIVVLEITTIEPGGFLFTYTIFNTTKQETNIGCRILLDSYLGEKSSNHFSSSANSQIQTETIFSSSNLPLWIESSNEKKVGFRLFFSSTKMSQPDTVLLANWKRINDAVWLPEYQQNRNFTLAPYSINDSAISLFWNTQPVKPSESRTAAFIITTNQTSAVTSAEVQTQLTNTMQASIVEQQMSQENQTSQLQSTTIPVLTKEQLYQLIKADYQQALTILQMINTLINSNQPVTETDIAKVQALIDELLKRKGQY
mgnify:CR=1 FL=1